MAELKNEQLMTVLDTLGIKQIYRNSCYTRSNSRIENIHNFLKRTMAKFMHGSQLKRDDVLSIATYFYNIAPSVDDLESPFHFVHGRDPLKEDSAIFKTIADTSEATQPTSSTRAEKDVETPCKISRGEQNRSRRRQENHQSH